MESILVLRTVHVQGPDVKDCHVLSASAATDSWHALDAAAAIITFGQLSGTFCQPWLPSAVYGGAYKPNPNVHVTGQIEHGILNRAD